MKLVKQRNKQLLIQIKQQKYLVYEKKLNIPQKYQKLTNLKNNQQNNYVMLQDIKSYLNLTIEDLKLPVILKQKQSVFFLILNTKANSFTRTFVRAINEQLDIVQKHQGPTTLVTLSTGKLFSGGLDLPYMSGLNQDDTYYFVLEFIKFLGRLSAFPCITICLVYGAAIAGGCMLAFAFDYIYVYQKGIFRLNEVQLGAQLSPGLNAVIRDKLNKNDYRDMILTGKIYNQELGLKAGFVEGIFKENALQTIFEIANQKARFSENKLNFKKLKEQMKRDVIDCCFNRQHATGVKGETKLRTMMGKL